jgi:hypothetical protein
VNKKRRVLVERVWRASNLTWQEAERLVDDAIRLGKFIGYQEQPEQHGNNGDTGSVAV